MNAAGAYAASVPIELPTARGGLPTPIQIVFGGHVVGAAGLGWDVPFSFLRVDTSVAKRKPSISPNKPVQGRTRVTLSLAGQAMTLVPKGNTWVAQADHALYSARPSGGAWLVYDGEGHSYTFTEAAGYSGVGMWLLTSISGPSGTLMTFEYRVRTVPLTGGNATSIDLERVSYNFNPSLGCAKDVIDLAYGDDAAAPLSITATPTVVVRMHTLTRIDVQMRSSCTSLTSVQAYSFTYAPDADTALPRLQAVTMTGRAGTPEASDPLPVAIYHYGSASSAGTLSFVDNSPITIPLVTGLDPKQITSNGKASLSLPGGGQSYATFQSLTDVTGDGRSDLVFANQNTVWVAKNVPSGAATVLSTPTVLGDSATVINGPVASNKLTVNRFSQGLSANKSNSWRQFIDMNGDGRIDIIDASVRANAWTVYLNTPGAGASGVTWRERVIPIMSIRDRLASYGHSFEDGDHLPLARHYTAREYKTNDVGDVVEQRGEYTYTEWELKDINGDGLPDFVFNTLPIQMQDIPVTETVFGVTVHDVLHVPMPGPASSSVQALFNVTAVTLDSPTATPYREVFSAPSILVDNTACGVELWQEVDDDHRLDGTKQLLRCALADVTGDGIVDRIDHATARLGLGAGFSNIQIPLPMDFVGQHFSGQEYQCLGGTPATTFQSFVEGGLRDVTADGIADLIVRRPGDGAQVAYVGTGFGFRASPLIVTGLGNLSSQAETCDGESSTTFGGLFDIDGDGRPESVSTTSNGQLALKSLAGGSALGNPEATQLVAIDNGYGATTEITYRSAKEDGSTRHSVPFPEIVVTSVRTRRASETASDALSPTLYAYGDASLVYDNVADAFVFSGYRRMVSMQTIALNPDIGLGQATITDSFGLGPYGGGTHADRYARQIAVGRTSAATTLAGSIGTNPWPLLTIDASNDSRQTSRITYAFASKLVEEPAAAGEALLDCLDWPDPYDYDASLGDAVNGYDTCSAHGFAYPATTLMIRGAPASTQANVSTKTRILAVDDLGRTTSIAYDNDVYRSDDDLCVDTTYALPTGQGAPVLVAPATRRLYSCVAGDVTYRKDTYEFDGLSVGKVTNGFETSHTVDYFATDTGAPAGTTRVFDGTYDALGNLVHTVSVRDDGVYRETMLTYDPFGLAVVRTQATGTNLPTLTTTTAVDPVTLAPLVATDPNGTQRAVSYDGVGRVVQTSVAPPGSTTFGIVSTTRYSGFGVGSSGRTIAVTEYDDPIPPAQLASATGHAKTTLLDELGRSVREETALGADYGGKVLVTGYRTYDSLGRVAFEADPFLSTENAATAYGTSRSFQIDGTPSCFVRAQGPHALTAISDAASETYAQCFYHGYANHLETFGVSDPDANLPGSPQAGVLRLQTATAIGRVLSRTTSRSNQRLEYTVFGYDALGHTTSETRFKMPWLPASPVTTTWRYDSAGRVLQQRDPEGQITTNVFDSWGETTAVAWSDTTTSPAADRRIVATYDGFGRLRHREERYNGVVDAETMNDYEYDVAQQVSPNVAVTNALGRLTHASAPSGETYFSYDTFGARNARIWIDSNGQKFVEKLARRKDGTTTAMDLFLPDTGHAQEHVDFAYDSANRLIGATYKSSSQTLPLYKVTSIDPYGRLLGASYGATSYQASYASMGRRLLQKVSLSSGYGSRTFGFTAYDAIGRELTRIENRDGQLDVVTTQSYDAIGRLVASTDVRGTTTIASWTYGYDALGNMGSANDAVSSAATAMTYRPGDQDELCRVGYPTASGTGCNVLHDYFGNVTSMPSKNGTRSLDYFLSGEVRKISDAKSTATFRYDPFGELQEVDLDGATADARHDRHYGSVTVRSQTTAGSTSSSITRSFPGPGVTVTLRGQAAELLYAFGDSRGTRVTTSVDGKFVQDVRYQPFGVAVSTGAQPGSTQYTSEQWNGGDALSAFGVTHLGARIYDPLLGRFLSRDPLQILRTAATSNPYAFAANDPINHSDPTGRDWQDGCIDVECQWLHWQNPFDFGGSGGGGSGHGNGDDGSRGPATPAPPTRPPMTGMTGSACEFADGSGACNDDMWPKFPQPGFWRSLGRSYVTAMDHVRDGVASAIDFVDEHAAEFAAGTTFVTVAFFQPEVFIADMLATGGATLNQMFGRGDPSTFEDGAIAADDVVVTEQAVVAEAEAATTPRAVIDPAKFRYLFGQAGGNEHNFARTAQNAGQMARVGVYDTEEGRELLQSHFESVVRDPSNITRTFTTEYGTFQVRDSLFLGPGGFVKFESTWQVVDTGVYRFTTAIPFGGW